MNAKSAVLFFFIYLFCSGSFASTASSYFWHNATIYFMLTDRFNNGDPNNDMSYGREAKAAKLRGFEGGDIRGIIDKLEDGYFTRLGVDAIWMTPLNEQIHGYDDSAARTYAYHGYWPKDWTAVDANLGTEDDLNEMIATAHRHNIKVLMDVIINHTGPETEQDWAWPADWVRTTPICNWKSFEQNVRCALAPSLTDIKTESENPVELPPQLLQKWREEGRLDQELSELEAFFKRTGYPRAPKYYIVKWLTDWVKDYGIDGFRVDTVKHVEADIWRVLKKESELSLAHWKLNNPALVKDDLPFYMVGEVYNWGVNGFKDTIPDSVAYNYGDKQLDFFKYGFDALINMGFATHAHQEPEQIFTEYSTRLHTGELKGKGIVSYLGSHDDHHSFDRERQRNYEAAFKLMLAPGAVQIYYGDELARPMYASEEVLGDAHMRRFMNWEDLSKNETQQLLAHWQKLGQFRQEQDAVGSGIHQRLSAQPYIFQRSLDGSDNVVVAAGVSTGLKVINVSNAFADEEWVFDYYSGQKAKVKAGKVSIDSEFSYVLLGVRK